MRIPRKVALLGATAVTLALIPASSAFAYTPAERRAEKRQNDRIRKLSRDLSAAKNKLLANDVTDAAQSSTLTSLNSRLAVIEGAAPQILKGLTDLGDAAKQLQAGLQQAGAGLESLQDLATSTEYGVGQVFIGGNPEGGAFVVTPDIPDAVQQAQVTQTFLASQAGAITLRVAVRSAESDGTGAALPAAHCRVTIAQDNIAAPAATRTSTPNAALGGAPFWPIDSKSPQTSTDPAKAGFPFGPIDTDNLVDLTTGANSTAPAGAPTAVAGQPFTVSLSCVDTSPSTSDPTA